ncbi:hypothetical protein [Paeniglutamicibacter antarcticus]|uniref:Uncharacterized protein n=1 Tax=Paeniglutamicibacter antarcticus TaxID=494023 RepID=A0ABP9TME0_9MICC
MTEVHVDGSISLPWRRTKGGLGSFALAFGVVPVLAGCSSSSAPADTSGTTSATGGTSTSVPTAEIPDGPAGKQLSWLLDATKALPIDGQAVAAHMSAAFV